MENFILYEEIGRGKSSIVYKGRRKGTIKFLAILCIEKTKRPAITTWVRLVHEIEHENVVKFYEWYETSNHLWMVVELCTGGLLQEVLNQDDYLPEMTVCQFGKDILEGLCYLHERGIVFADLCPKKILLDGPGKLKLTNFCISRLLEENLEEVYLQATIDDADIEQLKASNFNGQMDYQAPEIANGKPPSTSSDIWSLGILLFQLYTGGFPLSAKDSVDSLRLQDDLTKCKRKSFHRKMHQELKEEKPSENFLKLLQNILQKNPEKRPTAHGLLNHPFWSSHCSEVKSSVISASVSKSFQKGDNVVKSSLKNSVASLKDEIGDWTGKRCATPESVNVLDSTFTLSSRPHTAFPRNQMTDDKLTNGPSSRPVTPKRPPSSQEKLETLRSMDKRPLSGFSTKSTVVDSLVIHDETPSVQNTTSTRTTTHLDIKEFVYHDSDFELSVIQDNPHVRKVETLKWEMKSLPLQSLSSVNQVSSDEMYKHLKSLSEVLNQPSSPNFLRSKTNVLIYLSHLCTCSDVVANYVINSMMLGQLASAVKSSAQQSPDIASKAARAIGLAASYATELEQCTRISESFQMLVDCLRDHFRNTRMKVALIPCIGQLLFLIAEQENACVTMDDHPGSASQRSNWVIPLACYTLIAKCLREGEDAVVQHFACKIIEAVTTITGQHGKKFINASSQGSASQSSSHSDVIGPLLWVVAGRATNENLKASALSALCRVNKLSGSGATFQAAVDRAGLANVLSFLSRASFKCQQAIVTSLVETLLSAPKGHASRLAHGKDLLPNLMRLFESPSSLVRTKVILAVLLLLKKLPNVLVTACQQRLIMYIERESRRVAISSAGQNPTMSSYNEYTQSCLNLLIHYLSMQAPLIATNCISILDETVNRKHPSTNQVKQLRQLLPTCNVLQHFVTSQIFRSQIVTSDFIRQLGLLLSHASTFFKKSSHFQLSSSLGDEIVQKFVDAVISIVECLSQHPLVLTQHVESSLSCLVPNIIVLLGAYGDGDGQIVCIKLLTDVLGALLHYQAISMDISTNPSILTPLSTPSSRAGSSQSSHSSRYNGRRRDLPDEYGVLTVVKTKLIPELKTVMSSKDPLPSYGVRLLGTLLEYWPSLCVEVANRDLVPPLMSLFEKQACNLKLYVNGVTTALTYMVQYNDDKVVWMIYEKGLIETLENYLIKTAKLYERETSSPESSLPPPDASSLVECLIQLLTLMKAMLDRVTVNVKQALQNQNVSASNASNMSKNQAENAEQMLVDHKPLTELQSTCIRLLCSEQELHELALACLSMLVQLFGGDHPDTMNVNNMSCLAQTLVKVHPKRQRILLKLVKRIVYLNKQHASSLASASGSALLQAIRMVRDNAEKVADASVANLAGEILKAVD